MPVPRKKYILILLASLTVLLACLAAVLRFSTGVGSDQIRAGEHPLRISEYMANNSAYPNADGLFCDWVEIENTSDRSFNISGYRLTDDITQARFAFPVGTVIPAGGHLVVWCDPDRQGGMYAPFSLKKQGGETLQLMNSANTVLDRIDTLRSPKNISLIRLADGSLTVCAKPTPGFSNDDEGYAAYLLSAGQGQGALRLSEIMSAEKLTLAPDGQTRDWIEVENASGETADISGMHLSDKEGEGRYTFPAGTVLPPYGRIVVWCALDDTETGDLAPFRLSKLGGETVILLDVTLTALDRVQLPYLMDDTSYARTKGAWVVTDRPTPGYANTPEGYADRVRDLGYADVRVQITEIVPQNMTGLRDLDGDCPDWIELYNPGPESVSLEGWFLSDNPEKPARWRIPSLTLQSGERAVIFASGKDRTGAELHTDFAISAGETVTLVNPVGLVADSVEVPAVGQDRAWVRQGDGWAASAAPTPGA